MRIDSVLSDPLPITHGVPQGAILSPLLFCIYLNDLPGAPQFCKLESYADDSKVLLSFSAVDVIDAKSKLEDDLRKVATWCCTNDLLINPEKTKFMLIGTKHVMFTFHFITFSPKMTCSPIPSLASESPALASLLLLILSNRLLNNMDNRVLNGLLLVDLKKAFDLVNHSILLLKLQIYGCSSSTVQWFTSYLSDRSQCTNFKGTLSDPLPVSIGVPQGSILGPLFFLIHK